MSYVQQHLEEAAEVAQKLDITEIKKMVVLLTGMKQDGGRIFFLGLLIAPEIARTP